ncbi:MAG: asparagine synthase (glutamine-hydrolyzing) [Gammaproteobacteria bacterium]|nr:asparagine synthase (glutamine-hydrolyzing) [Gammaproteobacteria bacterium]
MCGIAGIYNLSIGAEKPDSDLLHTMISTLKHRGPDNYGFYIDQYIGLAHSRLSIIDLSTGKQPIHNSDKSIWVVFNGEIYNYVELREDLIRKGYTFLTQTDTEVIVHLYDEYGDKFVDYLNGQFAIALWDKTKCQLILARDRVGIAPLFYCIYDNKLYFGSEIKSIISALPGKPNFNLTALDQLFTFWSPTSPDTLFENVYEVSPGNIISFNYDKIKQRQYWDWCYPDNSDYRVESVDALAEELRSILIDATRIRLRADVPVGAYLSGGLDSSVLVSIIKNFTDTPLRTFSIEFDDASLDESDYQKKLINHFNTDHSRIKCTNEQISANFQDVIWHTELPILRSAPIPMSLLSELVHANKYKVVLTGEGSDEVLGGYDIFKETKIRQFWAKNKDSGFRPLLLKKLYPYLDVSPGRAQTYLRNFFGQGIDTPDLSYFSHMPRWDTTSKIKSFYSDDVSNSLRESAIDNYLNTLPGNFNNLHSFNKAQYIESKTLMSGYLLCSQGDRMLMKNSVEGRFPFLDHRLIEFANKLHPKLKMKGLNEKYLLKIAMGKYIPDAIVKRYKQPYRAPDIPSFTGKYHKDYVDYLLSPEKIAEYNYFNPSKVSLLMKKINAGKAIGYKDNMAFMGILSTQCLHSLFIENK